MKTAVIFGVTGQDGSYLSELLLSLGYHVIGVSRRTSTPNDARIRHLMGREEFRVVNGDVTDAHSVRRDIALAWSYLGRSDPPLEVYNLAAQSHVGVSFQEPCHTTQATYLGCLNILEAVRDYPALAKHCRVYQAGSSEMFGAACSGYDGGRQDYRSIAEAVDGLGSPTRSLFQDEDTPFLPNSPYAVAKLAAHHLVRVYRESYGLFACSGILFNHESERRGEEFVTRKITRHLGRVARGEAEEPLKLGNVEARRDWGHAEDYVRGMYLMLQRDTPGDYVLATGETHSVREFLDLAVREAGLEGSAAWEADPAMYRPCEVPYLRGDASKARRVLGWRPEVGFEALVRRMVAHDLRGCA